MITPEQVAELTTLERGIAYYFRVINATGERIAVTDKAGVLKHLTKVFHIPSTEVMEAAIVNLERSGVVEAGTFWDPPEPEKVS